MKTSASNGIRSYAIFFLFLFSFTPLLSQEVAEIKSIKSIYNQEDQARIKLEVGSQHFRVMVDQSKTDVGEKLNKTNFTQLIAEGKVPVLQPGNLKTTETETEIQVLPKKALPDEFSVGGRIYQKVRVEFEGDNGKALVTELYTEQSTDVATAAADMNFQWSSLGVSRSCKNPKCVEVKMKNNKPVCAKIRCGG